MKRVVRHYLGATFVWNAEDNTWHGAVMGMPVYVRNLGRRYEIAVCRECGLKSYYLEPTIKKAFFRILVHVVENNRKLFYTNIGFRNFQIVHVKIHEWRMYHNLDLIATFLEKPYSEAIAYQIQEHKSNIFWEIGL